MRIIIKCALFCICCFCIANVMAQNNKRDVEFGVELISELQGACSGDNGSATSGDACLRKNYVNLLWLGVSLPISSCISFDAASISTCMTASESIGGDLQTFSNLDAGNIPFALCMCGMSWTYTSPSRGSRRGASHSLFMGVRNMNEDYFTSPATSLFTNSSCGIYPTISANYPIANYPVASMGVHYCYDGGPIKVLASLYNGTGYNRFVGQENVFRVCPKSDGVFGIAEVSYTRGGGYYFIGNALYCKEGMNATPWFYTEQSITSNLTLLAGCSHAFATEAECKDFVGCGVLYQFKKCQLGAFTDYANFMEGNEFATELTCKIPISGHLDIQPTAHLISTDGSLQCVAMLRMALSF